MITRMLATSKRTPHRVRKCCTYRSYTLWVLVAALLITYGFGLGRHAHIPHIPTLATDHLHAVEVHLGTATGIIDNIPKDHADAAWFMLDLDGQSITKKTPGADFAVVLLGAMFLLYALRPTNGLRTPLPAFVRPKHNSFYSLAPPSRAPPG